MTPSFRTPSTVALLLGTAALAMILGALAFQYLGGLPPCEMCMWQRYPHIAAAAVGIAGFASLRAGILPESAGARVALLAALLIAVSGAIGVYHAGVEWQWWKGPQACTGPLFHLSGGPLDLNAPVVRCDKAAWRLFGLSLAGYNAILSFGLALLGLAALAQRRRAT